ncbi:MAG: hypothetical protein ACFB9M_10010 [Myxococcota bacterium]
MAEDHVRWGILLAAGLVLVIASPASARATEEATSGPASTRPIRLVLQISALDPLPLIGDPSLQVLLGAEYVPWRLQALVRASLPRRLNDVAASSVFENGNDFRVEWGGETSFVARWRPFATLGLDVQGGLGFERFELFPEDAPATAEVVETGFALAGVGYTVGLWGPFHARAGGSFVFLFGGDPPETVGDIPTDLEFGFFSPEFLLGAAF